MCNPLAFAAVGAGGALLGDRDEQKQLGQSIAAQNAQKKQMVRSLNYELSSISQEQRDQYDQAVASLQANSINSIRNQGMLEAALGETNLEGRSTQAVIREVQGQDARVADSIRDSYQRSHTGLQHSKETAVMQTQSALDGMPKIKGQSTFSRILNVANGGMQGYAFGASPTGKSLSTSIKTGANTAMNYLKGGK